jgi:hypothetical protein
MPKDSKKNCFIHICLFIAYLMTMSVAQTLQHWLIELMNNDLERIWKEAVIT